MAISVVQSSVGANSGGTTGLATSFALPVTSGNGVVVCVGATSRDATSVTDTAGNTYTEARTDNFFTSPYASVWHCANVVGGFTAVTVNFASSTSCAAVAVEVLGVIATIESNTHNANGTNPTPGAITTGAADRIVVACVRNGTATTSPSGFTNLYNNGSNFFDACYEVFSSIQTGLNPAWTAASTPYAAVQVAYSSTITSPPTPSYVTQKVLDGPPIPGSPWMFSRPWMPPRLPRTAAPVMPADVVRTYTTPTYGPPIPGAPWTAKFGFPPVPRGPAPPAPVPPVVPTGPGHGKALPLLPAVPKPNEHDFERRLARHTEMATDRLNALVRSGSLQFLGGGKWRIQAPAFQAAVDPTVSDDESTGALIGSHWVNTATVQAWVCLDNSLGAAVWKQVT